MANLYIIAGCNGAGKTTASLTVLPEVLNCYEFVNADSIAAGLSPLNPESVSFEAGRIMLNRIRQLLNEGKDFAFETTLATRSYVSLIAEAKTKGYDVTLLYFWLNSPEFARQRVAIRVSKGGHNIPVEIIERRYYRGLKNFLTLYKDNCDKWMLIDNMKSTPELIAESNNLKGMHVINSDTWKLISKLDS
jgi:predicted ABC-type ATPase